MRNDLIVQFVCQEVDQAVRSNTTLSPGAAELHLNLFREAHAQRHPEEFDEDQVTGPIRSNIDIQKRARLRAKLGGVFRDWIHEQPWSLCANSNMDTCPDWEQAYKLADMALEVIEIASTCDEPEPFTPRDEARTCVPHGRRDCEECYDAAIDHEMGMTEKPGVWNEHGVMGSEGVFHGKEGGAYQLPECDASEEVIEAVTSAIIKMNALPGPKLTHFMARQRAKAAINEMQDVIRSPDLMWPETINVKMGDNEFVCERLSNGVYEMPTGQIFIRMTPEDHVIKVANGQRLVNCPCGQPHPIADENLSMTCGYCNRHLVLDRSEPGRRPDFADYAEPFCSGWIARRENPDVKDDDGQAFSRLLMEAFNNSGSQRAKRMRTSDAMEELSRRFGTKLGQ